MKRWRNRPPLVRWLFWTGGLLTVGGLWWFFEGVDIASGTSDTTALVGGSLAFLVGIVVVGLGLSQGKLTD